MCTGTVYTGIFQCNACVAFHVLTLNLLILIIFHSWGITLIVFCVAIPNSSLSRPIHIIN